MHLTPGPLPLPQLPLLQFERFLFTLETTTHHLPDSYTNALASLAQ